MAGMLLIVLAQILSHPPTPLGTMITDDKISSWAWHKSTNNAISDGGGDGGGEMRASEKREGAWDKLFHTSVTQTRGIAFRMGDKLT